MDYPPVAIESPPVSLADNATSTIIQSSDTISESVLKNNRTDASDRFRGQSVVHRYKDWACVRQFRPRGLKFFDLILLAHVVHLESPSYTPLKSNCYWYVATILDAIVAMFGADNLDSPRNSQDIERKKRYEFQPKGSGRWQGLKITITNPEQISSIVSKYRKARISQMKQVICSFQTIVPY